MASVMQGDAYNIPVTIKSGNGTLITPEIAACVEIAVGQFVKRWPGQVTFDEKTGEWQFPVTQKQTFRFAPGAAVVQARVVFQDGSIMGGSGAPVSVVQSASRGTLPQPEKTEAATGSAPKATEVTIPTVHDINVSLHSQVILSDPIKAPYIGDNGNWYEYDAETGEFVDTGVKAGGGTDPSLGLTAATIGQIIKVKAVDTDGKPTAWQAVDDRLPNPSPSDVGSALTVERNGEFSYGYGFTHIPNLNDFIGLGIDNASPGQFAKVKYVDDVGKPTAWEAVDMAGGGEGWESIAVITLEDATNTVTINQDSGGNAIALKKVRILIEGSATYNQDVFFNDVRYFRAQIVGRATGVGAFSAEPFCGKMRCVVVPNSAAAYDAKNVQANVYSSEVTVTEAKLIVTNEGTFSAGTKITLQGVMA